MNEDLRNELLSMRQEDQKVLQELIDNGELGTVEYHPRMKEVHERNNARIKQIVEQHGWHFHTLFHFDDAKDFLVHLLPGYQDKPAPYLAEVSGFLERHREGERIVLRAERRMVILAQIQS